MIAGVNESKILTKECKCRFDGKTMQIRSMVE